MKLTKDQHKKIIDYIRKKWTTPSTCPVCKNNNWTVSTDVYEVRLFHGGNMVIGGKSSIMPLIPVICNECGNTILFNAIITGLDLTGGTKK